MEAFLIQRGAYIDASFDEMIQAYGSVFRYIQDGLGLEETEIDQIKEELLE